MAKRVKKVIDKCEGCIRVCNDNTCWGWTDPEYKWKNGQCPEYSNDQKELEDIIEMTTHIPRSEAV